MNFYIDAKKNNLKVISALKDFNNRNKIIKEGSRILTLLMNILQQSETDLLITCPFPKNIIQTMLIGANLQFHPSFFNLFYPKNYCQKYYSYRMINLMVYTPHLPDYSNVQVPSQLLFFRRYLVHLSDKGLIHQSSKLLQFRQYLRVTMILRQTTIDLSLYFQILIEYWRK